MKRLTALLRSSFRANEPLLKMLKRQVLGLTYLLSHPAQLKRIIIRETRFGQRYQSKRNWLEWQKYDQYIAHLLHSSAEAQARPLHVARIRTISDMVSRLGSGLRVLDVGCGHGLISEQIRKMGNYVTCVDLPTITSLVHRRLALVAVAADAEHLAFASNNFDVVLASELLEHLWNPHVFLDEANRVLRDEGHAIIEVPEGREGLRWDSHIQYFTLEGLKQVCGTRFNVCEVRRVVPLKGVPTIILLLRKSMTKTNNAALP
ncbi:MAG: class I SAM-dependent methyltransferase [Candidatus Bathyarchaeota archaeon]|nr:class I SAM-dependent methyltransferase [Candidatus Bathyarchaeota archaeon]